MPHLELEFFGQTDAPSAVCFFDQEEDESDHVAGVKANLLVADEHHFESRKLFEQIPHHDDWDEESGIIHLL